MGNNLGFSYSLSVDEQATKTNLNTFIKNFFGEKGKAKLSVPIKLDITDGISDINLDKVQRDINRITKDALKVKAKVDLQIDTKAINTLTNTVEVMQTLNKEVDKLKDGMKELGKSLTINFGNISLDGQLDGVLETSKKINEENKETELSLEEQLKLQKRILEEKRKQIKQTKDEIESERERLELSKERKKTNDDLIKQEKNARKDAKDIDTQIKAEKDKQKEIEKQNEALKEQQQTADKLKKTKEEIKKLESDKSDSQSALKIAKEEEQRRENNVALMKEQNKALQERIDKLQKLAKLTKETEPTNNAPTQVVENNIAKQTEKVAEQRIEQEKEVTNAIQNETQQQIEAIKDVVNEEQKAANQSAKVQNKVNKGKALHKKSSGKRRDLFADVMSAEISQSIHDEEIIDVRTLEKAEAEMVRMGEIVGKERGLLEQVGDCLERNKELTKENREEVEGLMTALKNELTLIQEVAGNRDGFDKSGFKKALKRYQGAPTEKNEEKLDYQAEKMAKIGGMYQYKKALNSVLENMEKVYGVEAKRSLEMEKKQVEINKNRNQYAINRQNKQAEKKVGFNFDDLKYADAGSFVTEKTMGYTPKQMAKLMEGYAERIGQFFSDTDIFKIDYSKTETYLQKAKEKIAELEKLMAETTNEADIQKYKADIDKANKLMTNMKKNVNTYEYLDALAKMKEGVTYQSKSEEIDTNIGVDTNVDIDTGKIAKLKQVVEDFTLYSQGVNLANSLYSESANLANTQAREMRQNLGWLTKDFEKLNKSQSVDEEAWTKLVEQTQKYKKELGVAEEEVENFIAVRNQEIAQGDEYSAKLKELQKTFRRGSNEFRECSEIIERYNNTAENNLSLTNIVKDMKQLINVLDRGKDSFDNFNESANNNMVKVVKNQKDDTQSRVQAIIDETKARLNADTSSDKTIQSLQDKEKALMSIASRAGIAEEKMQELVQRIDIAAASGKKLSKTEMGKLIKDFPTENLSSALEGRSGLISRGRKGGYNKTDEYKQQKAQWDALVENYTADAFTLYEKIFVEAKRLDEVLDRNLKELKKQQNTKLAEERLALEETNNTTKNVANEATQAQQKQTEAIKETIEATKTLSEVQSKAKQLETDYIDSYLSSLNGDIVNKSKVVPDEIIALMEAQIGTYFKNGNLTASFKDYEYDGYDNPRDKMVKDYMVYHDSYDDLNSTLENMSLIARTKLDALNDVEFQKLQQKCDELIEVMEKDIRDIIAGLEGRNASPFTDEDFSSYKEFEKEYPKQLWSLRPNSTIKSIAEDRLKDTEEYKQAIEKSLQINQGQIEKQKTEQLKKEVAEATGHIFAEICESVIKTVKAYGEKGFANIDGSLIEEYNRAEDELTSRIFGELPSTNIDTWKSVTENLLFRADEIGANIKEQYEEFLKLVDIQEKYINGQTEVLNNSKLENVEQAKKTEQVQQEQVVDHAKESVANYKKAYEEVMRLIEATEDYRKLGEESFEKIEFQDLRDREQSIDNEDINQWKEMYQLSLTLGKEMELNIDRERELALAKKETLEKTKALLSDGRTQDEFWANETEFVGQETKTVEENIEAIKKDTEAKKENIKTNNKVAKAVQETTQVLKEQEEGLVASTNVQDHIKATLALVEKIGKSATYKNKANNDSSIKEMFENLKREAGVNKSSGTLGIDYWDGLIERVKIFATEIVKMKSKTIDNVVNPLIYTSATPKQSTKAPTVNKQETVNKPSGNKLPSDLWAKIQQKTKETIQEIDKENKEVIVEITQVIQEQKQVEKDKVKVKQDSQKVQEDAIELDEQELAMLQEQLAKNEANLQQEEEALQTARETVKIQEDELTNIDSKLKKAKEIKGEQEQQLANAKEITEQANKDNKVQDESLEQVKEKIANLEEERRIKLQMADDLKKQIIEESELGDVSETELKRLEQHYSQLTQEANSAEEAISKLMKAIKYQDDSKLGVNPLAIIPDKSVGDASKSFYHGNNGGGNNGGGGNVPPRNGNGGGGGNPPDLDEEIKLKQRSLMLDVQKLVYGKDLTDNQKLMVNELVEQVVQLGRTVTTMKELSFEAKKIKQNINETKFDVQVTTTEDKNAKKLLEQQRKEKEGMYKTLFDQRIAEIDAEEKRIKDMTQMYTKLWEQAEKNVQVEQRAKAVLEDKVAKQRDLWQLRVKEFSQSENSQYVDSKDVANMKQMAENIGVNITSMQQLNTQLHEMSMTYKQISSDSKNTKAMFTTMGTREQAEAINKQKVALKELIAVKEEDLRQQHQRMMNDKAFLQASEAQQQAFKELREELRLTGETTQEVNAQYKQLTQQMNGMKIDMVTNQLGKQEGIFSKIGNAMKQYVTMNFDILDCFGRLQNAFGDAFASVQGLDEAYTNISMTMDVTEKQFKTMVDTALEIGNANGQLQSEVLNMMKVYSNAGTTVEEINSQMKATVAFQNVSDLDASSVTQSIQTILQQYKLLEEGGMSAASATEYLGDVMVAVSYNLAKEESVAMQEVIQGIEVAGNMIKTSGGSFEWFSSVIGTLSELMNATGSETANAMKMIAARTLKSKEALDDLAESGESIEDIEIAASNAEKALNSIGLTARKSNGDFKGLEEILGEVASKWDGLTDATKQYVSEQLAGNNRRSY